MECTVTHPQPSGRLNLENNLDCGLEYMLGTRLNLSNFKCYLFYT